MECYEDKNQLDATQWFIEHYDSFSMFRALLCPSSGACDYTDGPTVWHLTLKPTAMHHTSNLPQPR
jgi:hypothetical protein